jgi:hypothetical protein
MFFQLHQGHHYGMFLHPTKQKTLFLIYMSCGTFKKHSTEEARWLALDAKYRTSETSSGVTIRSASNHCFIATS